MAQHLRRMRVAYIVLAIALIPTLVAYIRVRQSMEARARERFARVVGQTRDSIEQRVGTYVNELYGLRAWFMSQKEVEPDEWLRYFESADVQWRRSGIRTVGYLEQVKAEDKESFVQSVRSRISPNFQIWPEGDRPVYYPLLYMKRFHANSRARRGQDDFAEPDRRPLMEMAANKGTPFVTGRVKFFLPDGINSESGLIIYMPVYRPKMSITTVEERRSALQGFVCAAISPESLLSGIFGSQTNTVIDFEVYDGERLSAETLLYDDDKVLKGTNPDLHPRFSQHVRVPVLNQNWDLYFSTLPEFDSSTEAYVPGLVLVCGLGFSLLLFCITFVQVNARERAERISKDLQRSEAALAGQKERLSVTLYSIDEGVITTDTQGCVVSMNKAGEQLTGWKESEVLGKPLEEFFQVLKIKTRERCDSPAKQVLETGKNSDSGSDLVLLGRDAGERMITSSAAPMHDRAGKMVGAVLVFRDITEKYRSEAESLKESKLESVGMLAGGIAHDFNNILQGIIGNISLARMSVHSADLVLERLVGVEKAAMRARDLTQQLLTFARGGAPIRKPLQLGKFVKDTAQFALHGSNMECEFSLAADLWVVEVDEGQFRQIINNLVINAMQAMPEGGKIEVRAENVELRTGVQPPLPGGKYVKISIRDHGMGIRPEHLHRVFDPYFTTKKHAAGLGLASAYSIVRKHDGQINVDSVYGSGSTFQIYLPAYTKAVQPVVTESNQKKFFGQGRILVMDDEEDILLVLKGMLKAMGYEVEVAREGEEAIERYVAARRSNQPFSAVIMDLTIPNGMGGRETIRRLKELDPDVKGIVSSGYSYDPVMANFARFGFSGVIPKPYVMEDLGRILKEVMEGKQEASNQAASA